MPALLGQAASGPRFRVRPGRLSSPRNQAQHLIRKSFLRPVLSGFVTVRRMQNGPRVVTCIPGKPGHYSKVDYHAVLPRSQVPSAIKTESPGARPASPSLAADHRRTPEPVNHILATAARGHRRDTPAERNILLIIRGPASEPDTALRERANRRPGVTTKRALPPSPNGRRSSSSTQRRLPPRCPT